MGSQESAGSASTPYGRPLDELELSNNTLMSSSSTSSQSNRQKNTMLFRKPRRKSSATRIGGQKVDSSRETKIRESLRRKFKRSSHKVPNFNMHIGRVLKTIHPKLAIGKKTKKIINDFLGDILERMSGNAKQLMLRNGRKVVSETDVRTVTPLLLPDGIAKDGLAYAARKVATFVDAKIKLEKM